LYGNVTVNDSGGLEANCQNVTIFLDANGNATVTPGQVDNGREAVATVVPEFDLSQTISTVRI
jgi:hypothetical protein